MPLMRSAGLVCLAGLVVLIVLGSRAGVLAGPKHFEVSADFADTTGLYVGNEVDYLGVPVGKITAITADGPVMSVRMRIDAGTQVPKDAVAEVLQSALLTDRYVQLGPAYRGGPVLADGAHIVAARTRSPINIDDISKAIDQLSVALDQPGPAGSDIGGLIHATAQTLDGNGTTIRQLLASSHDALADIDAKEPDLTAVVSNLNTLSSTLADRDAMIQRFTTNLSAASAVVAGQTTSLSDTLRSLSGLTTQVADFVEKNQGPLRSDLADTAAVAKTIGEEKDTLASVFDMMPTGSENIWRAFDPALGAMRVQLAVRDSLPFNTLERYDNCASLLGASVCGLLVKPDGTGLLDPVLALLVKSIPQGFP